MAEYKSNYTGAQIDEGIAKAMTASQTDKHLESVSIHEEGQKEVEVEKQSILGNEASAATYAGSSSPNNTCWWITNIPEYKVIIGKKVKSIAFTTNQTGTVNLYGYTEEIDCRADSEVTAAAAAADAGRTLLMTINVSETGKQTYLLDGTDSRVVISSGLSEIIMPATLGVDKALTTKILYNNSAHPAITTDTTIKSGFQQSNTAVPAVSAGKYQSFVFDFEYYDIEILPGEKSLRHSINDGTNLDIALDSLIPNNTISESKLTSELQAKISEGDENYLKGKYISFIGDSISTYAGYIPSGYSSRYPSDVINNVNDTWWYPLVQETGMILCSNASWNGSTVSGRYNTTQGYDTTGTSGYPACGNKRIADLAKDGHTPDIVVCFIGTNDWGTNRNLPLGDWDGKSDIPSDSTTGMATFGEAYGLMLYKIMNTYPDAKVYCCTLHSYGYGTSNPTTPNATYCPSKKFPNYNSNTQAYLSDFNKRIRDIANNMGATVIDIFNDSGITFWNSKTYLYDGVHPSVSGMKLIKNCVKAQLEKDFKYKK